MTIRARLARLEKARRGASGVVQSIPATYYDLQTGAAVHHDPAMPVDGGPVDYRRYIWEAGRDNYG